MSDDLPSDAELDAALDAAMNVFVAEQIADEVRRDEAEMVFDNPLLSWLVEELIECQLWHVVVRAMPGELAFALNEFKAAVERQPRSLNVH